MDMDDDSPESCKISTLWNWYTVDTCFLSSPRHIQNSGMLAASCIDIVILVISVEFIYYEPSFIIAITFAAVNVIMLLAMHFNDYIIICIILGSGTGKFVCHWLSIRIDLESNEGERSLSKTALQTTICRH
ncbi:Ctr domain-containing protein [Trichoderma compactum]